MIGNTLRVYFTATRNEECNIGNITNETVCTLTIEHQGKITEGYNIGFINGGTGAVSSYQAASKINGDAITVTITLAATTVATKSFSSYFAIPVSLNLNGY